MRKDPEPSIQLPTGELKPPRRWRRRGRLLSLALVPAAVVLAACSSSSPTAAPTSSSSANPSASSSANLTMTASNSKYGTILVDKNGKTLYTLTNGGQAVSCTGGCASVWPPLVQSSGKPATHNGLALYTFSSDQSAGQANGEGISSFGGIWHVVKVSGTGSTSSGGSSSSGAGSSGTTSTSSGKSGGYGY
jgi:predicted lipoprotein with Yx(FWY)xxD motif